MSLQLTNLFIYKLYHICNCLSVFETKNHAKAESLVQELDMVVFFFFKKKKIMFDKISEIFFKFRKINLILKKIIYYDIIEKSF